MKAYPILFSTPMVQANAICEGLEDWGYSNKNYLTGKVEEIYPRESFMTLWASINGMESWESNPWVWVYEFERTDKPTSYE